MTYEDTTATPDELATADQVEVLVHYDAEIQEPDGSWRTCLIGAEEQDDAEVHARHYSGDHLVRCPNRRVVKRTTTHYCWTVAGQTVRVETVTVRDVVSEHDDSEVARW